MNTLDVLTVGRLVRDESGRILEAHSTSTLVRTPDRLIVVDTSTKEMRPAIKTSLRQIGVFAKDVDTVVITHMHSDHKGNNDMFPNAEILVHIGDEEPKGDFRVITGNEEIAPGVKLVHTPGHSWDSMSVFVEGDDQKFAVVGDAIPLEDNFRKMVPPKLNICEELSMKSIKAIAEYADVIIPGHGFPFMTRL